jgi:hypothetical protein
MDDRSQRLERSRKRIWKGSKGKAVVWRGRGCLWFLFVATQPLLGDDGEAEWIESERQANFSREMAPESWRAVSFARGWPLIIVQSAPLLRDSR